ncbi:dCMP deaminase [Streptosporangium saharense]|uniref:Pyrimidine deaminase RibD-like protein n=1 Tax=Streptosporangium saharense TaxID=1706840 RepID=A0A7W7QM61_9ACTN|nr:dCMP deaminase [Streptosporangium saharense]MBB4916162.1 pyrimidine deaminase RibD-like protein [Streptosporangium saharense]
MDDHGWLRLACDLAGRCPPSSSAFSVGAVVVGADGVEIARGHSRETGPHLHAEEVALSRVSPGDPRLPGATVYSSLEPCSVRHSRPVPCSSLIIASGVRRVVLAWREPLLFVDCRGAEELTAAGVTVLEIPDLAGAARKPNAHLLTA